MFSESAEPVLKQRLRWAPGHTVASVGDMGGDDACFVTGRLEYFVTQVQPQPHTGDRTVCTLMLMKTMAGVCDGLGQTTNVRV